MKFRESHSSSKDSVVSWLYCYTKLQFSGLFCVNLRIEKDTYAEPQIIAKCLGLIRRFSNSFFPERTTFPKAQFKSDSSDCSYINILTFELNMYFGFTQINSCLVFTLSGPLDISGPQIIFPYFLFLYLPYQLSGLWLFSEHTKVQSRGPLYS